MPKTTKVTRILILVTVILAAATVGIEAASAQETTSTATATSTTTATPEPEDTVLQVVSPSVRVLEAEYRNGAFRLVVESDIPMRMTAVEGIQTDSAEGTSSGTITFKQITLDSGKNEVTVDAPLTDGRAFVVLSAQGEAAYISHNKGGGLLAGPYNGADVRNAWIGGVAGVGAAVLVGAVRAKLGGREEGERVA